MFKFILLVFVLSSCSFRIFESKYARAYSDRQCHHSHQCCSMDCACCSPKMTERRLKRYKKRYERKNGVEKIQEVMR